MTRTSDVELARTPALERLLARTRAALLRQVLAYGIGTVLGAASLWLVFAFLADWGLRVPLAIRVDRPEQVGADRLVNALAVHRDHGGPAVVVDFGTATTFDCVAGDGAYVGGAIAPGLERWAAAPTGSPRCRPDAASVMSGSRTGGPRTCRSTAASTTSTT